MDDFARLDSADRRAFITEAASRRDLTPVIIEKDFWVCWTLRHLTRSEELAGHMTFKGGTSLSKAYGIIQRFSEDIDLTIRRTAPLLDKVASPMEPGISGNERQRRTKALKAAAQAFVETIAMPALARAIEAALGTTDGWTIELDPEDADRQTLLFNYPRTSGYGLNYGGAYGGDAGTDYIKPLIKKATILHALYHNGKLRDGLSRHYYDLLMLDRAGVAAAALAEPGLLDDVVRNKSLMFADASASYATAILATLRLPPSDAIRDALARDYAAMTDMFMEDPPAFKELLAGLGDLEKRINDAG